MKHNTRYEKTSDWTDMYANYFSGQWSMVMDSPKVTEIWEVRKTDQEHKHPLDNPFQYETCVPGYLQL